MKQVILNGINGLFYRNIIPNDFTVKYRKFQGHFYFSKDKHFYDFVQL